jgi:hypothetical protein
MNRSARSISSMNVFAQKFLKLARIEPRRKSPFAGQSVWSGWLRRRAQLRHTGAAQQGEPGCFRLAYLVRLEVERPCSSLPAARNCSRPPTGRALLKPSGPFTRTTNSPRYRIDDGLPERERAIQLRGNKAQDMALDAGFAREKRTTGKAALPVDSEC